MVDYYNYLPIFLVFALTQLDQCQSTTGNLSTSSSRTVGKHKNRTLIPLILLSSTATQKEQIDCKWLKNYKYQRTQCKRRKGLTSILQKARQLAINTCSNQFRTYRWNCTITKETFAKNRVETAYLQSLTAAALMYTVSLSCTDGLLENCSCSREKRPLNVRSKWRWSGCGDNVHDGKSITSQFLKLNGKAKDVEDRIYKINGKVGVRSVARNSIKSCFCHGVSGSCAMKTCVRRLTQFETIASDLKERYHNAIQLTSIDGRSIKEQLVKYKKRPSHLLYLEENDSYCELTVGQRCTGTDHCATHCCGRGYTVLKNQRKTRCNFRLNNMSVEYEICYEDVFICK